MSWQDMIITAAQWLFAVALLPALQARTKPPLLTSLLTALCLLAMGVAFASLGLLFSAASCFLVAALWFVLFFQRVTR